MVHIIALLTRAFHLYNNKDENKLIKVILLAVSLLVLVALQLMFTFVYKKIILDIQMEFPNARENYLMGMYRPSVQDEI